MAVFRSKSDKELGTLYFRQQHFIQFLIEIKLPYDPTLIQFKQKHQNNILTCYTAYLAIGYTLLFWSIRADTIIKYINVVAGFAFPKDSNTQLTINMANATLGINV